MGVNSPLTKSKVSNIIQLDGNDSIISEIESLSSSELSITLSTIFDTDEEVDPEPIPAVFLPNSNPSQNTKLEVDTDIKIKAPTRLPLCIMLNARSLYNKKNNFQTLLNQIGPDLAITSETWEREKQNLDDLFAPFQYKTISYARSKGKTGGGCAIFYNESRFTINKFDVSPPEKQPGQFLHQPNLIMKATR